MRHEHRAVTEYGPWGFIAPVAVEPYTHENPAAHGNVGFTEVCGCGYERDRLVNGAHEEWSPWHESVEMREARLARERAERERARRWAAAKLLLARAYPRLPRGRIVALTHGIELDVEGLDPDDLLDDEVEIPVRVGGRSWLPVRIGDLRQAADAPAAAQVYRTIAEALP